MILAAVVIVFTSCVKRNEDYGFADTTVLKGRVVEGANYSGIPNITVSVTTGLKTHCVSTTNEQGCFELIVDWSKIDDTYYLFLDGGVSELQKKEELMGFLDTEYNYKDIVLYSLPTFQSGGATYQVAPDPGNEMTFNNANTYCSSLTIYGLSGWKLPTIEELLAMYTNRQSIGGFSVSMRDIWVTDYWCCTNDNGYYTGIDFTNGMVYHYNSDDCLRVRPIRRVNIIETDSTILKGRVVKGPDNNALPNIMVSVTNGFTSYCMSTTNAQGYFELTVDWSKIDETYYLFLDGGMPEMQKKVELMGFFETEYNYNDIILYSIPTFQNGGVTYQVAPDPGNEMTHYYADAYCNSLTIYGLSGWRLPTIEELLAMYANRQSIGGFNITKNTYENSYWSSTSSSGTYYDYIGVRFTNGSVYGYYNYDYLRVRPIRRAN